MPRLPKWQQRNLRFFVHLSPAGAKGVYMKKVSMSSTMGPGFTVDLGSLSA